jgi:glutathione S-transferase
MSTKLYYAPGACSFASHVAMEETGIAYETQRLNLAEGDQRKPEYLKLNPRGRVPTLVMGDHILTETVGIMTYFGGGYPDANIWPRKTWDQAKLVSTLAWLSNTVHPAYGHYLRSGRYVDGDDHQAAVKEKGLASFHGHLEEIDKLLEGHKWSIANQYTVADPFLMVFYRWGNRAKLPVKNLKNYTALVDRVMSRPAVHKVMADEGITLD